MPELPEVETICRGLETALVGRKIAEVSVRRPDLRRPLQPDLAQRLTGARVDRLHRRSKYILCALSSDETLMIHLGMSGRIRIHEVADNPPRDGAAGGPVHGKHDHVIMRLEDGNVVTYTDHRRFGMIELIPSDALDLHPSLATLGPEPFGNEFSAGYLEERLRGRSAPIKNVLLDQRIVAGIGNIYASEALWRAGIAPARQARRISTARVEKLYQAILGVLSDAIEAGGSSLRDYRDAEGELGYFQHLFSVYGRDGEECPRGSCHGTIRRSRQGGRSTFHCPACQR